MGIKEPTWFPTSGGRFGISLWVQMHYCVLLMGSLGSSLHLRTFRKISRSLPRTPPSQMGRLLLPQLHSQSQLQAAKQRRLSQIRVSLTGSVSNLTTHSTFLASAQ